MTTIIAAPADGTTVTTETATTDTATTDVLASTEPVAPAATTATCTSTSEPQTPRSRRLLNTLDAVRGSVQQGMAQLRPACRRQSTTASYPAYDDTRMDVEIPGLGEQLRTFRTVPYADVSAVLPPERRSAMHFAETVWLNRQHTLDPRLARYSTRVTLDELDLVIRVVSGAFRLLPGQSLSLEDALDWLMVVYRAVDHAREAQRPIPVELPYLWIHRLDLDDLDRQTQAATQAAMQQGLAELAADQTAEEAGELAQEATPAVAVVAARAVRHR